jgi:hypothetical protein
MLHERRASAVRREPVRTVLEVGDSPVQSATREASVLLDARGEVVGVDLRGEDGRGVVVMAGAHESVQRTRTATVEVGLAANGDVARVIIPA